MEQLQQTLEDVMKLWCFPFKHSFSSFTCWDDWVYTTNSFWEYERVSYHELFSKDSWLMEFMKWKTENWYDDDWLRWFHDNPTWPMYRTYQREHHAMMMWPLTATDKIDYFNKNTYL